MSGPREWYLSGCLRCPYSEHGPNPHETCPNDGSTLVRFPAVIPAWRMLEACRAMYRAFADARRARYSADSMTRTLETERRNVLVDA